MGQGVALFIEAHGLDGKQGVNEIREEHEIVRAGVILGGAGGVVRVAFQTTGGADRVEGAGVDIGPNLSANIGVLTLGVYHLAKVAENHLIEFFKGFGALQIGEGEAGTCQSFLILVNCHFQGAQHVEHFTEGLFLAAFDNHVPTAGGNIVSCVLQFLAGTDKGGNKAVVIDHHDVTSAGEEIFVNQSQIFLGTVGAETAQKFGVDAMMLVVGGDEHFGDLVKDLVAIFVATA